MAAVEFNIYKLLDLVRARPGMYIYPSTTKSLATFLSGYHVAMHEAGVVDVAKEEFHGFHSWVQKRFGYYESTAGWCNMILAHTLGLDPNNPSWENDFDEGVTPEQHTASLQLFFELLDEYRGVTRVA